MHLWDHLKYNTDSQMQVVYHSMVYQYTIWFIYGALKIFPIYHLPDSLFLAPTGVHQRYHLVRLWRVDFHALPVPHLQQPCCGALLG